MIDPKTGLWSNDLSQVDPQYLSPMQNMGGEDYTQYPAGPQGLSYIGPNLSPYTGPRPSTGTSPAARAGSQTRKGMPEVHRRGNRGFAGVMRG